ncbi:MAG: hypothetical protein P4L65_05375, partial [Legionella sp.]|nr:hypothetical protein [Legionella sp.]
VGGKCFARSEQTLTDAGRPGPLASRVGESISGTGTSRNLSRGSATLVFLTAYSSAIAILLK